MRDNTTSTTTAAAAAVWHTWYTSKGSYWYVHTLGSNVKHIYPCPKKIIPKRYDRCGGFSELVILVVEEKAAPTEVRRHPT